MVGILESFMGGAAGGAASIADEELRRRAFEDAESKRLNRQMEIDRARERAKTEREGILARAQNPLDSSNDEMMAIRTGQSLPEYRSLRESVRTGQLPSGMDKATFDQRMATMQRELILLSKDPEKRAQAESEYLRTDAAKDVLAGQRKPGDAATAAIISKGGDLYGGNEASTFNKATGDSRLNPLGQAKVADERAGAAEKSERAKAVKEGRSGVGKGTAFSQKYDAWLATHPGDEAGALRYASGDKAQKEGDILKRAGELANQDIEAGAAKRKDFVSLREKYAATLRGEPVAAPAAPAKSRPPLDSFRR